MYNFWIQPTSHCDDNFSPSQTIMPWVLQISDCNFECRLVDCSRSCRCQEALEMISTHPMLVKILHRHQQLSSLVQRLWHSRYVLCTSPCFIHSLAHSNMLLKINLLSFLNNFQAKVTYEEVIIMMSLSLDLRVDLGLFP
jgi:hypothetical protein